MRIVGIDPSLTNTGLCIISPDNTETISIPSSHKLDVYRRQRKIVSAIKEYLRRDDIVTIEDFGISARFSPSGRFCERIELCGMIKLITPAVTRLPWLSVSPTMLKSFIYGKANAHKTDILKAVQTDWQVQVANDDEADAFGLARYTNAVLQEESRFKSKIEKFESYGQNKFHLARIKFLWNTVLKNNPSEL